MASEAVTPRRGEPRHLVERQLFVLERGVQRGAHALRELRKLGSPLRSMRNGSVFTKKPTTPARSGWLRPVVVVASAKSSWSEYLCSAIASAGGENHGAAARQLCG